jgi:hypothetical protein
MVGEPSHVKQLSLNHVCKIGLKGHGNEADFLGFCRNWILVDPLHYLLSRSDFDFEFAEIFVIKKRFPDSAIRQLSNSASRGVGNSTSRGVDDSQTCRVGETAFECLKENSRVRESVTPQLG